MEYPEFVTYRGIKLRVIPISEYPGWRYEIADSGEH